MAGRGFQCQAGHSLTPFAATFTRQPASVANKRLTGKVSPLNATLTKNRGEGPRLWLTSHPQHPSSRITEYKSVPLLAGACRSFNAVLKRRSRPGRDAQTFSGRSRLCRSPFPFVPSLPHYFIASPWYHKRTVAFPLHCSSRPLKKTPPSLTMESPVLTGASEKSPYLRARSMVAIET